MFALLNWRLWLLAGLVAALSFSHFTAYRAGKANVRQEWTASIAQANADSRKLEQQRQRRADEAAGLAARRASALAADARRARLERDGLRGDLQSVELYAQQSLAAANDSVRTLGELLGQCSERYLDVARDADAAYSEVKTLRDAWPE